VPFIFDLEVPCANPLSGHISVWATVEIFRMSVLLWHNGVKQTEVYSRRCGTCLDPFQ
jgi:hypothetical protein